MSDTIEAYKAVNEARKDFKSERLALFMHVLRRMGVTYTELMPYHLRLHSYLNGKSFDVWPTTDKYRLHTSNPAPWENSSKTHYGALGVFVACGYNVDDLKFVSTDVELDPNVYRQAIDSLMLGKTDSTLLAIIQNSADTTSAMFHSIAWKYFFGPFPNPRIEWDAIAKKVLLTYDLTHELAPSHEIWNPRPDSLEFRIQCLEVMSYIAEDKDSYAKAFN